MAETYRKSKIEKLIHSLETRKQVLEISLDYWNNDYLKQLSIQPDKSYLEERIAKIELINEILIDVRKSFNLS